MAAGREWGVPARGGGRRRRRAAEPRGRGTRAAGPSGAADAADTAGGSSARPAADVADTAGASSARPAAAAGTIPPVPPPAADPPLTLAVDTAAGGQPIKPGFLGFSFEFQAVRTYTGSDPRRINPVLVQLIRNLTPGQAPVLRIGGDSTDLSYAPAPGLRPPAAGLRRVPARTRAGWRRPPPSPTNWGRG